MVNFATLEVLDKDTLEELYSNKQYSSTAIARLTGVTPSRIRQLTREYNIPSHGHHFRSLSCRANKNLTKGALTFDYWECGLSQKAIAKKYAVDPTTVFWLMKRWDIPARKATESTLKQRIDIITARKAKSTALAEEVLQTERRIFELTPDYIVGFTDGEGSFSIGLDFRLNPPSAYCDCSIGNTNREIVEAIKQFFGFGSTSISYKRGRKTFYTYSVNGVRQQLRLAQFFLKHPLSVKAHTFSCWLQALQLIAKNEHRTEQGFRQIVLLKEAINAY